MTLDSRTPSGVGEVFDLGYKRYEGPREGRMRSRKAIWMNGVRTAIGLGRGWQSKVLPGLLFIAVMIPAVVMSLTAATAGQFDQLPTHADYYRIVSIILFLFSATIAPELLCPDRRDRVIDLYLVRPLTTTDYVVARWGAFFAVMLALVLIGQIVLYAGLTLAAEKPLEYAPDHWKDVPRFIAAGIAIAAFATTIPLAVSTFTVRRTYAAAIVIAIFVISLPVAGILTFCEDDHSHQDFGAFPPQEEERRQDFGAFPPEEENSIGFADSQEECEPVTGDAAKWFALISFPEVPMHVSDLIFDEESGSEFAVLVRELPAAVPVGWLLILTLVPGGILWWQYQRMGR